MVFFFFEMPSKYEQERFETINRNKRLLQQLEIENGAQKLIGKTKKSPKKNNRQTISPTKLYNTRRSTQPEKQIEDDQEKRMEKAPIASSKKTQPKTLKTDSEIIDAYYNSSKLDQRSSKNCEIDTNLLGLYFFSFENA